MGKTGGDGKTGPWGLDGPNTRNSQSFLAGPTSAGRRSCARDLHAHPGHGHPGPPAPGKRREEGGPLKWYVLSHARHTVFLGGQSGALCIPMCTLVSPGRPPSPPPRPPSKGDEVLKQSYKNLLDTYYAIAFKGLEVPDLEPEREPEPEPTAQQNGDDADAKKVHWGVRGRRTRRGHGVRVVDGRVWGLGTAHGHSCGPSCRWAPRTTGPLRARGLGYGPTSASCVLQRRRLQPRNERPRQPTSRCFSAPPPPPAGALRDFEGQCRR